MVEFSIDRRSFSEVYSIIKLLEKDDFDKIPKNIVDAIRYNMDFKYEVDYSKIFNNDLLDNTKRILAVLYIDYLATYEERNVIYKMESLKHTSKNNEIFSRDKKEIKNTAIDLILKEDKSFFEKIIDKIKKFFVKRK